MGKGLGLAQEQIRRSAIGLQAVRIVLDEVTKSQKLSIWWTSQILYSTCNSVRDQERDRRARNSCNIACIGAWRTVRNYALRASRAPCTHISSFSRLIPKSKERIRSLCDPETRVLALKRNLCQNVVFLEMSAGGFSMPMRLFSISGMQKLLSLSSTGK